MRILIRPRGPVVALLLLAPTIPELLTGSTPVSEIVYAPLTFAFGFAGIVGLYGCGALLIREFAVYFGKGWGSILLLGAAYGIAEEGLAVHTFFEPAGRPPVGVLGAYGHAFGVNWLWALGLTAFHAVYSIALPILLARLWFPAVRDERWLDRGAVALVAAIYVLVVVFFARIAPFAPSPELLALFLGIATVLIALALRVPGDLLRVRPGPSRIGPWGLGAAGSLFFAGWTLVLLFSGLSSRVPAVAAAAVLVAISLVAIALVLGRVGAEGLEMSEFYFATGMLVDLMLWDFLVEFSVPGILAVAAIFAYLLVRLHRTLRRRSLSPAPTSARDGAAG